jgi:hypothetical protein
LAGQGNFAVSLYSPAGASNRYANRFNALTAIAKLTQRRTVLSTRDDDIRVKLGRIRDRGGARRNPDTFVGEVMRAAKKAGHVGNGFGRATGPSHRSRFGRGRGAALSLSRSSHSRRVLTKAHVVRYTRGGFRSAALSRHVVYLKRDGVTHDGTDARMFDVRSDVVDEHAFAERSRDDRHHSQLTKGVLETRLERPAGWSHLFDKAELLQLAGPGDQEPPQVRVFARSAGPEIDNTGAGAPSPVS